MELKIYSFFTIILTPFMYILILFRLLRGKENKNRFMERFAITSAKRNNGSLLWIHAASVGESFSMLPLVKKISQAHPNQQILFTTGTVSSAKLLADKLSPGIIHQFLPIDNPFIARRFLKYWRPNLVLWTESEFWPNLIENTAKICPIILVNGRVSDNSYQKWSKYNDFIKRILLNFSLIIAQSKQDQERLSILSGQNVEYCGNIKYSSDPPTCKQEELNLMKSMLESRIVFMGASTHDNEEEQLITAYVNIKKHFPKLILILSPRHPDRRHDILSIIKKYSLNVSSRSQGQDINIETDIYLADTMGEYGIFYRVSDIVFIGGSLIPHGGQNILEPARLGNVIIFGPYMHNFKEISHDFLNNHAAMQVLDRQDLENMLIILLSDKDKQDKLCLAAKNMVNNVDNILTLVFDKISPFLLKIDILK